VSDDAGTQTVREVFEALQIDADWSTWSDRGFTWWPHRLAQRVWAEIPTENDGVSVMRVNAETDQFSASEQDWRELAPVFGAASMLSVWWSAMRSRTIRRAITPRSWRRSEGLKSLVTGRLSAWRSRGSALSGVLRLRCPSGARSLHWLSRIIL
jgi:hypothetical protein